ncbi:hypothetical protein FACS189454_02850 [Planctomycetales bacterium]|nr:hypothetical protein FACS189454_02850 [Planctomycetales bacterium]
MQTFQLQTMIPNDGRFSFVFPEFLRGRQVEFNVVPKYTDKYAAAAVPVENTNTEEEDYVTAIRRFRGTLKGPIEYSDLREEEDREI